MITWRHEETLRYFLHSHGITAIDVAVAGFYGLPVLHNVDVDLTVQLGDGALVADLLQIDVVFDFRAADVGAKEQGVPS